MSTAISDNNHELFIRQAIELSLSAVKHGNHPFGACLVSKDGQVLLTAENTVRTSHTDVTRHAELNLISMATQKFGRNILEQCTLYTSCEPCLMCTGAFLWSGIQQLVYALSNETLGKYAGFDNLLSCRPFLPSPQFTVIGPVLEDEAAKIHQTFWSQLTS
jgi:tRNA(Arg) A34 adenosine deaminase TadA